MAQLSTDESHRVVYGDGGDARPWREAAAAYLAAVARRYAGPDDVDLMKRERRTIGRAWRTADEQGGCLLFRLV